MGKEKSSDKRYKQQKVTKNGHLLRFGCKAYQ